MPVMLVPATTTKTQPAITAGTGDPMPVQKVDTVRKEQVMAIMMVEEAITVGVMVG